MKAGSGTSWLVGITLLAFVGGLIIYSYADWPGARYFGIADKEFWDYLKLLIVPAALAIGVYWLNTRQAARQRQAEDQRQARDKEAQKAQVRQALDVEDQRAQDAALQAYLDQMSGMLIPNKDQPSLYEARPGDSLSSVARARTLTVLPRLDGDRKARVVQFLHEAGLISSASSVLALSGADLQGANLQGANLLGTNLLGTNLQGANLSNAFLSKARLIGATLNDANLRNAKLFDATLSGANLSGATLRKAHLSKADLSNADLSSADLSSADLSEARLRATILTTATLSDGNLSEVDLVGAKGVTDEQLARARFLEGATMPNGQKYEDWIKDKANSGQDGNNE